jgi:hypothetical protein
MERVVPSVETGMFLGVRAKKHLTVFKRKEHSTGAGSPAVKAKFKECALKTLGEPSRLQRNAEMQKCIKAADLKTGVFHRRSGARPGSPLHGKIWTISAAGTSHD